jgi:hypothetical protein
LRAAAQRATFFGLSAVRHVLTLKVQLSLLNCHGANGLRRVIVRVLNLQPARNNPADQRILERCGVRASEFASQASHLLVEDERGQRIIGLDQQPDELVLHDFLNR